MDTTITPLHRLYTDGYMSVSPLLHGTEVLVVTLGLLTLSLLQRKVLEKDPTQEQHGSEYLDKKLQNGRKTT